MSDRKTVSACMIVKNAGGKLSRTLDSIQGSYDQLVIVDTGSDDIVTKQIAEERADVFAEWSDPDPICITEEALEANGIDPSRACEVTSDFAAARNFSYSLCTGDLIFWIDAGDTLSNPQGLRSYIETLRYNNVESVWMAYDYEHDEQGHCTMQQSRERITTRGATTWRSPIHEVLCQTRPCLGGGIPIEDCRVVHEYHDDEDKRFKSLRNYLVMDRAMARDTQNPEPRAYMNRGNSLVGLDRYEEAIDDFREYLSGSSWNEEKYMIHLTVSFCFRRMGDLRSATQEVFRAVSLEPRFREAYIELANLYLEQGEWKKALHWSEEALDHKDNNLGYRGNPYKLKSRPHEAKMHAYVQLGKLKKAADCADKVLESFPGHHKVLATKAFCLQQDKEKKIEDSFLAIEEVLHGEGSEDKIQYLRKSIPDMLEDSVRVRAPFSIRRPGGKLSMQILCGDALRTWGHDSIDKGGIGGSETAVIRMVKEFVELGWHVEVYGLPDDAQKGEHGGAHWLPYWRVGNSPPTDVFINWRAPWTFPVRRAACTYVWLHDVQREESWSPEILEAYDTIIPLSDAHRSNVEFIPDDKIWISRNGLDPSFWEGREDITRIPNRMVYASCPSRGLGTLAKNWDEIQERVPGAEIDIYYGFNRNFMEATRTSAYHRQVYDTAQKFFSCPGVNFYGMVDQKTLGDAFARAGVWAYPCNFPEISCITAMQAQCSGAIPVTTGYWALDETVQHGVKVGDSEMKIDIDPAHEAAWVDELCSILSDEKRQKTIRLEMVPWARTYFPWSKVAEEWDHKFRTDLVEAPVYSATR